MATMYALFLGVLLTAVCFFNGGADSVLEIAPLSPVQGDTFNVSFSLEPGGVAFCRSMAPAGPLPFVLTQKVAKSQGLAARLNCLRIFYNQPTAGCKPSSAKLNSPDKSGSNKANCLTKILDNFKRLAQPRPFSSGSASRSVEDKRNDLLRYVEQGSGATVLISAQFAENKAFRCMVHEFSSNSTLLTFSKNVALQNFEKMQRDAQALVSKFFSDEFWFLLRSKGTCPSGIEDKTKKEFLRNKIIHIAHEELGVREATGNNDGTRVEEYLRYTNLGKGYDWCAAFVSWCYGQAGLAQPRNPWSPALFPNARIYWKQGRFVSVKHAGAALQSGAATIQPADIFGIYGRAARRINHVGLVKEQQGKYLVTIEGNSNNGVESRRRHLTTVYAIANWVEQ